MYADGTTDIEVADNMVSLRLARPRSYSKMVKKARVFAHKACAGTEGSVGVCDRDRVARLWIWLEYERAGSLFVIGKRSASRVLGKRAEYSGKGRQQLCL